jgi:hypothetical protein
VGLGEDGACGLFKNFELTDYAAPPTAPVITESPQNVTAGVGQTASFWVNANGSPTPSCQWYTNSVGGFTNAIVGATNFNYTTPVLTTLYNGLQYSVVLTNVSGSVTSAPAALTVVNQNPTVYSAEKGADTSHAIVVFSEAVDATTGLNPLNYTVNNGVTVSSASYGTTSNSVVLTTSTQSTNYLYKLTVQNVNDLFGNTVANTTVPLLPAGLAIYLRADSGLVFDNGGNVAEWIDQTTNGNNAVQYIGGPSVRPAPSQISGLGSASAVNFTSGSLSSGDYLTAPTSSSLALTNSMTIYAVANVADLNNNREIVSKTVGSIAAPYDYYLNSGTGTEVLGRGNGQNSGTYTGTTGATPTAAQVYSVTASLIGTNGASTNGAETVTHFLNGIASGSGTLTVGAPSYVADIGHPLFVGGRSDLGQWMNGEVGEVMIYNGVLSPVDRTNVDNYLGIKYCAYTKTLDLPATLTTSNGYAVTYNFAANQGSAHLSFQWQENGTNIPGATGPSYTTPILSSADSGWTFDVEVVFFDGTTTNSTTNTLTVLTTPPFVAAAGIALWNTNNVVVQFNEAVDPTTATVVGNYSLAPVGTVLSAAMGDQPNKVILTATTAWNANPGYYTVTASNVKDLYGNIIAPAATSVGLYPAGVALWVRANSGVITNVSIIPTDFASSVYQWNDLSGNGNNLQADSQYNAWPITPCDPYLTNDAAGRPVVYFNGSDHTTLNTNWGDALIALDYNQIGTPGSLLLRITGDMSIVVAASFTNSSVASFSGAQGEIIAKTGIETATTIDGNQSGPFDYHVASTGDTLLRGTGTSNGSSSGTAGPAAGNPNIIAVTQAGTVVSHYLDNNLVNSGTITAATADAGQPVFVGCRGDWYHYNAEKLTGNIYELVLVGSALSSNDVASLSSYLAAEYNVPIGTNSYPAITTQPVAVTNVYQSTTLTVVAGVSGNLLAYQWYATNNVPVAGQTSATLVIPNIQTTNAYYLVVTNSFGSAISAKVVVNVIPVNTSPTNIMFSVNGGTNLQMSWPTDHTGWQLQAQTNSLAAGLNTNWVKVANSTSTNLVNIPIVRTNGSAFFRLVFPPQ